MFIFKFYLKIFYCLYFFLKHHNKLEYHLDFKGGKCYKYDNKKLQKLDVGRKKHSFIVSFDFK